MPDLPDMIVRLKHLPDPGPIERRLAKEGYVVERAAIGQRPKLATFIEKHFSERWALQTAATFSRQPISLFVALSGKEIVGFAAYDCSYRSYFGPTGVREDLRGKGVGAALLLRTLEDMTTQAYKWAIIGEVDPVAFYQKVCGAVVIPGS